MKRWSFAWALCLVVFALQSRSLAQDVDAGRSASARALFEEGVAFADRGNWSDAADRFERALALRDSQVIRFNLANALSELGKLVEASELLRKVELDDTTDAEVREEASRRMKALTTRIPRLTIEVKGPVEGMRLLLDEHEIAAAQVGVGIPVNPGEHNVRGVRGDAEIDAQSVVLAPGSAQTVTLHAVRIATPAQAAATVVPVTEEPAARPIDKGEGDPKRARRLWWGIGGGVVAAAVIVAVSVLVAGHSGGSSSPYHGNFDPPSIPVQVAP